MGNGLKFTHQGGVTLAVRELPAPAGSVRLRFEAQDTGIGIAPDRQAELFQPFVQADSSTARHYGGSGLGLAICQRLVAAMGGVIGLSSEVGRGSLFWFELPFERGQAAAANRSRSNRRAYRRCVCWWSTTWRSIASYWARCWDGKVTKCCWL